MDRIRWRTTFYLDPATKVVQVIGPDGETLHLSSGGGLMASDLGTIEQQRIMAFDPASKLVGWCRAEGNELLDLGQLDLGQATKSRGLDESDPYKRIYVLYLWATTTLYHHSVQHVALELPTGDHENRHTDRVLGVAFGALMIAALNAGCELWVYRPNQVKSTGFSKNTLRAATLLAGRELADPVSEDEADALGLWQCCWRSLFERHLGQGRG